MSNRKQEIEARGANVSAAIQAGLAQLGLRQSDVIVKVLDEGSRGLLGLGAREAVVRLTAVLPATPPPPPPVKVTPPPPPPPVIPVTPEPIIPNILDEADDSDFAAPDYDNDEEEAEVATEDGDQTDGDQTEPDPEEAEVARDVLLTLLHKMDIAATVSLSTSKPDDLTGRQVHILDIQGEDLTPLIGVRGETLNSLQYLTRLMAGHRLHRRADFVVDVQGYRQRREVALASLAEHMARKALRQQRPVSLEPMPPYERRIIHMTLRDHKGVYTQSVGEGTRRKVRILPK